MESYPQVFDNKIHKIDVIPESIDDNNDFISTLKNVQLNIKESYHENENINTTRDTFFDEVDFKFNVQKQLSKFEVKLNG